MSTSRTTGTELKRCRLTVRGRVQGVGFRPTLYRALTRRDCAGSIRNTPEGVQLDLEAPAEVLREVVRNFRDLIPSRARVDEIQVEETQPRGDEEFSIVRSSEGGPSLLPIPPDLATCAACGEELTDPADRRGAYPFNTCTACGPRFTIAREVPFDRPTNSMAEFPPCPECAREYADPADRRFHAQTLSCPACGPSLKFLTPGGEALDEPLRRARRMLREGGILAVKGVGGFHLACDGTRREVVEQLRRRKQRPGRPFALMAADLAACRTACRVSEFEEELLTSARAPIVLMEKRPDGPVADAVAPGLAELGVMLPYTPLHSMLFGLPGGDAKERAAETNAFPRLLVMTSCNRSEEPIALSEERVLSDLADLVDGILTHDRIIENRCDDSVVAALDGSVLPMRRSRGYVPEAVVLDGEAPPLLAAGAMLKNTFAVTSGRRVFLSQHIGDVSDADNAEHFAQSFDSFARLLRVEPEAVVCDLHPDYPTTEFARDLSRRRGLPLLQMQHHHAHLVSCLAENGEFGPVIGVSWDGTGYGADGAVWGGEFLVADRRSFRRAHHFEYVPMPGGEQAVWHPLRMTLSHLVRALGEGEARDRLEERIGRSAFERWLQIMDRRRFSPLTSSAGRAFDAVAGLLGTREETTYEGQPACELEALCAAGAEGHYEFHCDGEKILLRPTFRDICRDLDAGVADGLIAARFHNTMARIIVRTCRRMREESGIETVALSGGVMQNRTLVSAAAGPLREEGFRVLLHSKVPPNDGGICLGQAAWAFTQLDAGAEA